MKRSSAALKAVIVFFTVFLLVAGCSAGGGGNELPGNAGGGNQDSGDAGGGGNELPGNAGGDNQDSGNAGGGATGSQPVPSSLVGEWIYIDSGSSFQLTSETNLTFEKIDENLLKLVDPNQMDRFLIRSGSSRVNVRGIVADLSTGVAKASGPGRLSSPKGVGGMNVVLQNINDRNIRHETESNDDGTFDANDVISGDYEVTIEDAASGSNVKLSDVKIEGEEVNLGVITFTGNGIYNFKTELILDEEYIYDSQTYQGKVRIKNVGDMDGLGLSFDIASDDETVKTLEVQNVLGTVLKNSYRDVPIKISFNPVTTGSGYKQIKITVKISDATGKTWDDYIFLNVYKNKVHINISTAVAGVNGYLIIPGHKLVSVNTSGSTYEVPIRRDKKYQLVLSNSNLADETAYSIGIGRGTTAFEGFKDTAAHEPNNKESEATILHVNESIASYLHAGDIDYYSIDMSTLPVAPINVNAVSKYKQISISWETVNEASSYNIYWSTVAGISNNNYEGMISDIAKTSYNHEKLESGTNYFYVITEIVNSIESKISAEVVGSPLELPKNGLVAYYPFNGNANDESGNENHGTVLGASLTVDRFGGENFAYKFDGINDYIKASSTKLPSSERTISLWFKTESLNNPVLLSYGGGGGCGTTWFMEILRSKYTMSTHCGKNTITASFEKESEGKWIHWVMTTATNGTKIFINGTEIASNTVYVSNTYVTDKDLSFGVTTNASGYAPYVDGNVRYFKGTLDDIRMYNRALSDSEIQLLFNEEKYYSSIADAGIDQKLYIGSSVTLAGIVSNEGESEAIEMMWVIKSKPEGSNASFSNPNIKDSIFTPDLKGIYELSFVVNDGVSYSSDNVTIDVIDQFIGIVTSPGQTDINISWDNVPEAVSYNLYWSTSSDISTGSYEGKITNLSDTTYTHEGLTKGTKYYYAVSALTQIGDSNLTVVSSSLLPESPKNVVITPQDSQVTITWGDVPFAQSYNVYWSDDQDVTSTSGIKIANVTSPYIHTNIPLGIQTYYVVTAIGSSGESIDSSIVNILMPPGYPSGISTEVANELVTISWGNVSGAETYNIYWSELPSVMKVNGAKISNVTSPYIHTGRTNLTTYYYIVTAVNIAGESADSIEISALLPPDPPTGVAVEAEHTQTTVSWNDVIGAETYNIYWSAEADVTKTNGTKIENITSPYIHTDLTNSKRYYYVVIAVASGVESGESIEVNALLPPNPPKVVTAGAGDSKVTVRWKSVEGAESYNIYWSEENNVTKENGTLIENVSRPFDHLNLSNDTTYYYVVTALNNSSESNDSSKIASTPREAVYSYNFEGGMGNWSTDNGLWAAGAPTSGPNDAFSGINVAGTVLDGNYPRYTDSRLISPPIDLPIIFNDEEIQLRFFQWFSYSRVRAVDVGYVQISVQDDNTKVWSNWVSIGNSVTDSSPVWSQMGVDLTPYSGKRIRIAFYHTDDFYRYASEESGWYVDNINIFIRQPEFPGNFELGWGDWMADRGVWQVGNGSAVTVIGGKYPRYTDSRLISPSVTLPTILNGENIDLRFDHSFSYSRIRAIDAGYIQVSVQDEITKNWSAWTSISSAIIDKSPISQMSVDLTPYSGKKIRIAFYHTDDFYRYASEESGWTIKDVKIVIWGR